MIKLTREDRVHINDAIDPFRTNSGSQMQEMIDAIYRAGMAAMAERAAKAAEGASITNLLSGEKMNETQRLRLEVEQLNEECRQLNNDLTYKEQMLERVIGVMEKQVAIITKLLDKYDKTHQISSS